MFVPCYEKLFESVIKSSLVGHLVTFRFQPKSLLNMSFKLNYVGVDLM
jgi:hypothetical protein